MPTEADLRAMFGGATPGVPRVDPSAVIRMSRRRRLPKQLAAGGAVTLAVAGIGVASLTGLGVLQTDAGGSALSSAEDSGAGPGVGAAPEMSGEQGLGGIQQAPADRLNLCGGTLAEVAPSETGLVLTPDFPVTAPATAESVSGTVTLTNTGTQRVVGTTAATPAITVSQNGLVLWHSNGPMIMIAVEVDLEPGESMEYPASFTPVRCEVEDDLAEGFRADLPPLTPGTYQLSAAIDLVPDSATAGASSSLVTGPATAIAID